MRKFVSLPIKIMGPLMLSFIVSSALITLLWVNKNNQDYNVQQQTMREKDQKQFWLIGDMLRNRMELWFESFIHFQVDNSDNIEEIAANFQQEFEYMKINWQINNLWLFDGAETLVLGTAKEETVPAKIQTDVKEVLTSHSSISHIRCLDICEQQISMPMLTHSGNVMVLSIGASLMEALAALHQSTSALLAIVSTEPNSRLTMSQLLVNSPISQKSKLIMEEYLEQLPDDLSILEVLESGYKLENKQGTFLLNLTPIEKEVSNNIYLLFVHDISDVSAAHRQYRTRILVVACVVVCLSLSILFFMTSQFRRRLMLVTEQLPLLAAKKYQEFSQRKFAKNRLFIDEIELLQNSASLLGKELESLDKTIVMNTYELEKMAMNDWLTGLPNRNKLGIELKKLLPKLQDDSLKLVVMFVDVDKFRKVNDTHGHKIGDAFLVHAGQRIMNCLHDSEILFRFGGDEFVIVFLEKINSERSLVLANKLIEGFRDPLSVEELLFYTSISIGITSTTNSDEIFEDLIRQSDLAMYASKDEGGGRYSIFNPSLQVNVVRQIEIENEVRDALENNEFSFALQPQVEISTGKLLGFEALIRWFHPKRGFIRPDEFIPLIENSERMVKIGYWGIRRAFEILEKLDQLGFRNLKIAVNLSAIQFMDPDLLPFLEGQLKLFSRDPSQIEFEITERTLVDDFDQALTTMNELKAMGFIFSIDDFGTGYSSLAYLKKMPVDIIKIDRSFVSAMEHSSADMQIVSSIIAMVQRLGMIVVAEG
ncbi:EAL domain-containing protein [Paraglaciecola aquimarina]|uniref:EAL domain-containing protein n=1 Tax=Paraglaciecola aquimarina TaxID=1235557 RepID=A0ABU3SU04_9ALTE|nr:EAL domain-containing protein [Paraglaciecola aquimarina]MDU0353463.1 EAL domain-containing protein [Paraglaciecola aquimarina]